jgi:hypothetical protein
MIQWMLMVSLFSPGGDFISKTNVGPMNSKQLCIDRKNELLQSPEFFDLKIKARCIKIKKEANYSV